MGGFPTHEKQNPLGQWMVKSGITSREVAQILGVTGQTIGNWRRGGIPADRIDGLVVVLEGIAAGKGLPAEGLRDLIQPCPPRAKPKRDRRLCGFREGRGTPFDQLVGISDATEPA